LGTDTRKIPAGNPKVSTDEKSIKNLHASNYPWNLHTPSNRWGVWNTRYPIKTPNPGTMIKVSAGSRSYGYTFT
jgi:hypothetical protein